MPSSDEYGDTPATADTAVIPRYEADTAVMPAISADNDEGVGSVARNSAVMALGSVISRATGFLRNAAIGAAIGAKLVADDYTLANTLPNLVYEFLLGGVLASVIVPVLVRARKTERDGGEAYSQRLLTLAVVFFGAATIMAVLAAPLLTSLMANDHTSAEDKELTTALAYLLLPEIFFYGMAALLSAILNVRGHFAAPMWTPILNNVIVILTAGIFAFLNTGTPDAKSITDVEVAVLGVGTTLGIVAQAVGLWPALRKVGFRWRWRWDFGALRVKELARLGSWMLLYIGVNQIGVMVVLYIARLAGDNDAPGPMIYNNAFILFMMAHGIVAVSIGTALMPRMSSAAADGRMADLALQLSLGTRLSSVILIPIAAAYVILGRPIAVTLFEWGHYTHNEAINTGPVIAAAGIAILPYSISQLQTFVFFSLEDTRLPALLNIPVIGLRLVVAALFWVVLSPAWIAASLMGSSVVSFVAASALGYWFLRRRIGRLGLTHTAVSLFKLTVAATTGALASGGTVLVMTQIFGDGKLASAAQLILGGIVLLIGYCGTAFLLRTDEIKEVIQMVGGRLGRS